MLELQAFRAALHRYPQQNSSPLEEEQALSLTTKPSLQTVLLSVLTGYFFLIYTTALLYEKFHCYYSANVCLHFSDLNKMPSAWKDVAQTEP